MTDSKPKRGDERVIAEFDAMADSYYAQHKANVAITGEEPEYFAEYKIIDLARFIRESGAPAACVFDFGSGIGNSLPFFRKHLRDAALTCGDVSTRSIDIARQRFPGDEDFILIDDAIPLVSESQDVVFSACVFHHIPHEQHDHWLRELLRVTRPGGLLTIYEHNPLNPLTLHAVNTCPLDVNARLIRASTLRQRAAAAGWSAARIDYRLFFPAFMKALRPAEPLLSWLPLGAQYRMAAWRPR
jgi:SAM-dependent methyltransferase